MGLVISTWLNSLNSVNWDWVYLCVVRIEGIPKDDIQISKDSSSNYCSWNIFDGCCGRPTDKPIVRIYVYPWEHSKSPTMSTCILKKKLASGVLNVLLCIVFFWHTKQVFVQFLMATDMFGQTKSRAILAALCPPPGQNIVLESLWQPLTGVKNKWSIMLKIDLFYWNFKKTGVKT